MAVAPMVNLGMPDMMVTMGMGGATVPAVVPPPVGGGGSIMFFDEPGYRARAQKTICIEVADDRGKPITICKEIPSKEEVVKSLEPALRTEEANKRLKDDILSALRSPFMDIQSQIDMLRMDMHKDRRVLPIPITYYPPKYIIMPERRVEVAPPIVTEKVLKRKESPDVLPILLPIDRFIKDINTIIISIHEQNMNILEFLIKNPPIPPLLPLPPMQQN